MKLYILTNATNRECRKWRSLALVDEWEHETRDRNGHYSRWGNVSRTKQKKAKINKSQSESKYKICKKEHWSINHFSRECCILAQNEYKLRHGCEDKRVHWVVSWVYGFRTKEKCYEHESEAVIEMIVTRSCGTLP